MRTSLAICLTLIASFLTVMDAQPREPMPGGYRLVSELDSENILKAASFCVQELQKKENGSLYSPLLTSEKAVHVDLIDAEQQVVAGLNYRLTIELKDTDGNCLGAFEATVYDHFGDLSVTKWGKEITCEEVKILKAQAQAARERIGGRDET